MVTTEDEIPLTEASVVTTPPTPPIISKPKAKKPMTRRMMLESPENMVAPPAHLSPRYADRWRKNHVPIYPGPGEYASISEGDSDEAINITYIIAQKTWFPS